MRPVLILYSSREGQTRKVVAHVIEYLTVRGKEARIDDVENPIGSVNAADYRAVVLAASVHLGQHASETIMFVRKHLHELRRLPTAFLAVSLAAGSAEDERQEQSPHPRSSAEVAKATKDFLERTGFAPSRVLPLAGAVLYTAQGRFARFVLQRMAHDAESNRPSADAWARLDRFVDEFLSLRPPIPVRKAARAHG